MPQLLLRLCLLASGLGLTLSCALGQNGVWVVFENESAAQRLLADVTEVRRQAPPRPRPPRSGEGRAQQLLVAAPRPAALVRTPGLTAADWSRRDGVVAVYPDYPVEARRSDRVPAAVPPGAQVAIPNDPGFFGQWNFRVIDAAAAWDVTTGGVSATGRTIVTAVVESNGFALDHPELTGRYYVNPAEIAGNGIDDDGNGYVDDVTGWNFTGDRPDFVRDSHGAHVVATLAAATDNAAQTAGLNWDASILPLQVSSVGEWTLALDYIADLRERFNASGGAEGAYVVVGSMSLGQAGLDCAEFPPFSAALERLGRAGVLSIASVDNVIGDVTRSVDFPTSCPSEYLVMVTATDSTDQIYGRSGYGPSQVDLTAPGAEHPSIAYVVSGTVLDTFFGTSAATPHVAGVVALAHAIPETRLDAVASSRPEIVPLLLRESLLNAVDRRANLAALVGSGGRLNARSTLDYLTTLLDFDGATVVAIAPGAAPPPRITAVGGDTLLLRETLAERLNVHLYLPLAPAAGPASRFRPFDIEPDGVVVAAAPDVRLTTRAELGGAAAGTEEDIRSRLRLPDAERAGGFEEVPVPVVGIFASGFGGAPGAQDGGYGDVGREAFVAAPREVAGNGLDDDGNGYVDDVSGRDFSGGTSSDARPPQADGTGGALADVVARYGRVLRPGSILPLSGATLSDWVVAAEYSLDFRLRFNASGGEEGLPIAALATLNVPGALYESTGLVRAVGERLLEEGILLVAPGVLTGQGEGTALLGTVEDVIEVPADPRVGTGDAQTAATVQGGSVGVALAAAATLRLFDRTCSIAPGDLAAAPRETAARIAAALSASNVRGDGPGDDPSAPIAWFDAGSARLRLDAECTGGVGGELRGRIFPNPVSAGTTVRLEATGLAEGPAIATVLTVDGREVSRTDLSASGGYASVDFRAGGLAAGVYVVRVIDTAGESVSTRLVVAANTSR